MTRRYASPEQIEGQAADAKGTSLEFDNRFDEAHVAWRQVVAAAIAAEGANSPTAARIRLRMAAEELGRNRPLHARRNFDVAFNALNHGGDSGRIEAAVAASKFAAQAFSNGLMPLAAGIEHSRASRGSPQAGSCIALRLCSITWLYSSGHTTARDIPCP